MGDEGRNPVTDLEPTQSFHYEPGPRCHNISVVEFGPWDILSAFENSDPEIRLGIQILASCMLQHPLVAVQPHQTACPNPLWRIQILGMYIR